MFRQYSGQKNGSRGLNAYGQIPLALTKYEDIAKDVYLSAREDEIIKKYHSRWTLSQRRTYGYPMRHHPTPLLVSFS